MVLQNLKRAGAIHLKRANNYLIPISEEGLLSLDSLHRPYMIPIRIVLFPWYLLPQDGTIAADTQYYPFGTRMYVTGYGHGIVEDRGGLSKVQTALISISTHTVTHSPGPGKKFRLLSSIPANNWLPSLLT